ncbi:MAG: hypothetical protein HS114_26505 [Anaerolineales bacterium]|nr:hypothetical protein [Anaerolineales bacterium]
MGDYHNFSIVGFWLRVEWLWQDPLPDELQVLRKLGLGKEVVRRRV